MAASVIKGMKHRKKSPIITIGRRDVPEFVHGKDKQSEKGAHFTVISWSRIILYCIFLLSTKFKTKNSLDFRTQVLSVQGAQVTTR